MCFDFSKLCASLLLTQTCNLYAQHLDKPIPENSNMHDYFPLRCAHRQMQRKMERILQQVRDTYALPAPPHSEAERET